MTRGRWARPLGGPRAITMESMTHATRRPRKTVEDYMALPDDVRAELIDGELYMTPSPNADHQRVSMELCALLRAHLR